MRKFLGTAVVFVLCLSGCFLDSGGACSMLIRIDMPGTGKNVRTAAPGISMEIVKVKLTGAGPGGKSFECTETGNSTVVRSIAPGNWKITAEGLNGSGTVIGRGETSIELIPYIENVCGISIRPLDGTGTIKVRISWEAGAVYRPGFSGTVSGNGKQPASLSLLQEGNGATAELTDLDEGYYLVTVSIYDGTVHIGGFAEAARVLQGQTTEIAYTLSTEISELSCTADLRYEMNEPVRLALSYPKYPVVRGDGIAFSCVGPDPVASRPVSWFLNGILLDPQVTSIRIDTTGLLRYNRIDSVVFSSDMMTGGSIMHGFIVENPQSVGNLTYRLTISDNTESVDGLSGARDVAVSPDGSHVFVAGYDDNSFVELYADIGSPSVSFIRSTKGNTNLPLAGITGLAVSPDGTAVFAVSSGAGALVLFASDPSIGSYVPRLSLTTASIPCLSGVSGVAVSPDGRHLYTVSPERGVGIFSFNSTDNSLALLSTVESGDVPSGTLFAPRSIAVSRSGALTAMGCYSSDSVFLFSRDGDTGGLQPVQVMSDGLGGMNALNGVEGVTFSSDGRDLFVCSYYDNALVTLRFNPETALMELLEEHINGVNGVGGLKYAKDAEPSQDGRYVYLSGSGDDALAVFSRDAGTGKLTFSGRFTNGEGRLRTLDSPRGLAVSASGRVFVTAAVPGSLNVFDILR